jgi:putative heme transporter
MAEDHAKLRSADVPREPQTDEEPPGSHEVLRVVFTRRRLVAFALFVISSLAFLYFVLPKLLGLQETWNRLQQGNVWWLALAAVLTVLSFAAYVWLFRAVFVRESSRIGWRESYEITMAGLAATRLFAAGGAGGVALTAWALRRSGLGPRTVAARLVAFLVLLYGIYMATLVVDGLGLYVGLFPGHAPFAITVVPALLGALVIALFLAIAFVPGDLERLVARWASAEHWSARVARRAAAFIATTATGVRTALDLVRSNDPALIGTIAWWALNIAILWACFHAFGSAPPQAVIVMAYFVGMLGNLLPLPGGIGGVDGGMIGAFTAFGVGVELSVVAVLAYRAFAFWLPTLPGTVAYLQLRRTVQRWRTAGPAPSYT